MKDTEFRVWDKKNEYMDELDGHNLYIADNKIYEICQCGSMNYQEYMDKKDVTDQYELMQYTGLRDCKRTEEYPNGQKIYEGDIVKAYGEDINFDRLYEVCTGIVVYDIYECAFCVKGNEPCTIGQYAKLEIIGNIYENPELSNLESVDT